MNLTCRHLCAIALAFVLVPCVQAVITAPLPLQNMVKDVDYIAVARIREFKPDGPTFVLGVEEDLKGNIPYRRVPVNFKLAEDKSNHQPLLLKRVGDDLPVILFVTRIGSAGKRTVMRVFTEGTWFSLEGAGDGKMLACRLTSAEPYLRRTYKGTTAELRTALKAALENQAKLPELDEKETPGFGPELPAKSSRLREHAPAGGGPLFAVIPTLGVGAPLAILALLFPALFGGVLGLFREWIAFVTVLGLNSTILLLHPLAGRWLRDSWWGTPAGLWYTMCAITALGLLWAWRRQLHALSFEGLAAEIPRRTQYLVLLAMSAVCAVACGVMAALGMADRGDVTWCLMLANTCGVLGATAYKLIRDQLTLSTPLATEGIMLGGALAASILLAGLNWGAAPAATGVIETNEQAKLLAAAGGIHLPSQVTQRWVFEPSTKVGCVVSSPAVHGGHVIVGAAYTTFKNGSLYCLDRATGQLVWEFDADGDLKEMISSPTVHDGRIYLGEGFHDDPNCKAYCIDAKSGTQVWDFSTQSQTESTPVVHQGRVYVGGGNDGFYCLDAKTGAKVWQFPAEPGSRLLRFGAQALCHENRVYAATGVDRNQPDDKGETAVFCLDAASGKLIWKTAVALPCWGAPVLRDGQLYVALGNGDIVSNAPRPAGQVLCLDPSSGAERWRFDAPNGFLERPAVDHHHLYLGCRDGHVYCLTRHDGRLSWKLDMGSPVIATPAIAQIPGYDQTAHVFAAATQGKVCCLDPNSGAICWTWRVASDAAHLSSTPRVVVSRTPEGHRRQIIFGASLGTFASGRAVVYCLEDLVAID